MCSPCRGAAAATTHNCSRSAVARLANHCACGGLVSLYAIPPSPNGIAGEPELSVVRRYLP
ncbi:hypothetical protein BD413DRAFT_532595 [Trametes elegans]|nr:hypothetical protein BD413DRAFT_532595 [Trametes elegans]